MLSSILTIMPKKARIELIGLGWFLLPFLLIMADMLFHYGWASLLAQEGSDSPNGLHGLWMLKMSLPFVFLLAALAAVSMITRHLELIAPVRLWTVLIALFPAAWFAAERFVFYILWWVVRLTNPDVKPRRISKEPLLEPTMWYGLAVVLILILASFVLSRRKSA